MFWAGDRASTHTRASGAPLTRARRRCYIAAMETSELFGETVRKALDTGVRNIVVDLGHTPWIDLDLDL